ncbi:putative ATP-dependent RNA helicase ddx49 [Phytophthora pseudosyringae]|uniref:Putative ATP-dependent RNA helicase ddx49 n=1 Tax=Phytophthora pseudosyringae TaxID=221518 RepID=A0A8T1VU17_9STRA|nr:putative ATP-dependent RNA helicase ddx49 [Phytophthora pseudosyringae]
MQRGSAWPTTNGTGYEPHAVQHAASCSSSRPADVRWGRLAFAQLRDEEFLAKQLRRIEMTQGARRAGRSPALEATTSAATSPSKTIRQRLAAAQAKAARAASEDDEFDAKAETSSTEATGSGDADGRDERALTNALCVLGDLQQPQLAAFMGVTLKDALRRACTFPNPIYQLIALRRQLMKSMHEAVAAQHRQRKAAVQLNVSIAQRMETSLLWTPPAADPVGLSSGSGAIKPKEKASREAAMGIQVLVCLLTDLQDATLASITQRREFLEDLLPLLREMGFLALSPRRGLGSNSSALSRGPLNSTGPAPGAAEIAEFTEKLQRFLLAMCPRPTNVPSSSPKLLAISSGAGELEVLDRTNAVNGLIHVAAATGSVRDFLVVLTVLLGANDYVAESGTNDLRASLLTSSVPSLVTEELLPSPINSRRDDDVVTQGRRSAKEAAGATRPDSGQLQNGSPLGKRETDLLGDSAAQDPLRRKTLSKGLKTIIPSANAGTPTAVNLAMPHVSAAQQRLLFGSPGNNLAGKQMAKDELKDAILMGNASLSLDMAKMKETLARDSPVMTTRSEIPVVTARCPKFKALAVQSVLLELDRAKPSAPARASRAKPTSSLHASRAGCFSTEPSAFAADDDDGGDREVWTCGQNSYGELGHGDTASRKSFERVEALQQKDVVQVGAGNEHTIALTADGRALTCGYNDNGQCGQGGTARVSHLSEVPKLNAVGISQVHAYNGCEHTIVVTADGRAATCGYNYRGQLGHGNTASESVPKLVRSLENKVVRLVSCSYYHTVLACEEDGSGQHYLYTFGRNDYGQLGHNDSIDRKVPQHVEALSDQHVVSVACGQYHTMVVTATGKAFAFGKNDYGQLGMESMENQLVPVQVRTGLEKHECLEICCGYYHTIVLCSGAHVFGFGRNDYGQLGLGSPHASSAANLQLQQQRFSSARLIEELEGKDIVRFACGCYHTLAVSDNGVMYVFGRNNHGQLGTGDTSERVYPFPIDDFVGKRVALVAAGFYHTVVLTGGKDDEKNDQDAGSGKADIATATSVPSGITHTTILSAPAVQELLDPSKRPELGGSGLTKSFISRDDPDAGAEVSAIDPTDDDFRDEDSQVRRNASSSAGGGAARPQTDASDALFVAAVVLAQLDRLCQPFLPKSGSYPTLQHPSMSVIESLTTSAASPSSSVASFDASSVFDGSFESFGIHNCSSTFESLAVLLKHLSSKKVETASQLPCCLAPPSGPSSAATATPRRPTQPNATHQLQLYMLLASIRVLQANLSQLLRSGMAKAIVLLSPGTPACKSSTGDAKPWATELDRTQVAVLQVREVLLALVDIKHRRNVCYVLDNAPSEGENATRVAEEAAATLMQGFELFFPCECLQRQFCLHTMQELASNDSPEHSCGLLCRRDMWLIDTLPKSKTLLLEPLLRRMAEDPLIIRFLPLVSAVPPIPSANPPENERARPSLVTEVYQLLLERTAAGFSRRLAGVVAFRPSSETPPRQETAFRAFFEALGGLQKHLSSWAASVHEWTLKQDTEVEQQQPGGEMEALVASVVDRVFRVDEQDLARVPVPWRCFIEFALATLAQCCEALGQASSLESLPSPTHGYDHRVELGAESLHSKTLDALEHSVVGQFLPLLVVSLFEFSNNSLFAAALLPTLKSLLRLLDGFNRGDATVEEAEKLFVESVASSCSPRAPQNESAGSFRRSNLLALGSARGDDGKTASRKTATTSDAMALPWHFRLEKELAVLAAEMAVTLVIGDPFFTCDGVESAKLSARWLASPLFRGGLNATKLTQSIKRTSSTRSKHTRVVAHTPFPAVLGVHTAPFSLILPPAPANRCAIPLWQLPTAQNYGEMFRPYSVKTFLLSLLHWGESETPEEPRGAATKLCDWVRDKYATKDPSYRMLMRQAQLSMNLKAAANALERQVHDNDAQIEAAFFAACLHHNLLGAQACHFALGLDQSPPEQRPSPPRAFIRLWQCVAQLRRRVAAKKTEIKNTPQADSESPLARIAALQQTILDRCELLLLVDVHDEQEHLNLQLDAGYVAPYDPAFLVSASSSFKFGASSAKRHLHATYSDGKLPFLAAFPSSKWRRVRTLLHTMTRWKFVAAEFRPERQDGVSQEALAYVTSDEPVASKNAIKTLLVDPCRRVSCSVRGLEALWELVALVSFDSVQADIVHQVSHVFVSQPSASCPSILAGSRSLGFFFSSLQNEAFSEFLGQVTEMMTDKAALMMASDASSSFWVVIELLSAWGVHFSTEQFEFVSEIGILRVIQEMLHGLSRQRGGCDTSADASPSIPSVDSIVGRSAGQPTLNQFATRQQLSRLEDALWVVFRFICVHFAVQTVHGEAASRRDVDVPTFPVLADVTELLYSEAAWICNRFLPLLASDDGNAVESTRADPVAGVRRSFEAITLPHRFSAHSRGATFSYDGMISPSGCEPTMPMSPLTKPNEFSVTTWLFINCSPAPRSPTMDGDPFDLTPGHQDRQLVLVRGAGREISLYVVLVPESSDNWQLEVGILMDLDREAGAAESSVRGRVWERVLSKQSVAGGSWIHVAVVLEATKLRLYLNGVLDCQRSLAAQSVPVWAAGNVDLPLHFGRFPTAFEVTATSSSVSLAIEFLSRSLGILNGAGMTPSNNASEQKTGGFRCFDGWLSHFRFHNRSLSPIHVRIVFDEKKSPSGVAWGANEQSKLVELHALVILLSSSSEGLVHFTSQFPKWMRLIWGTFLGSDSAVVQQSALRVLRALMSLQPPLEASKVLVQECTHVSPEALGFYNLEDVFAQQVIRMIGFCLSKSPPSHLSRGGDDAAVVSWPLMVARGIHASQFSPEVRGSAEQQADLPTDVELRYQSSKRQSLMLANELNQLLQVLFRCSNDAWRRSVIRVTSRIAREFSGSCKDEALKESEPLFLQFGKHTLHVSTVKRVESVGCFYFLGGGIEFLRPGLKVEMRGSRERAQVLSLEHHTSSQNAPETVAGTKAPAQVSDTLAYVRMDSNSSAADLVEFSTTSKKRNGFSWYEAVFGSKTDPCRSYSKVHVDELHPAEATNPNTNESTYPSIIYDLTAQQSDHNVLNALVEKAAEVIPLVYSAEARRGKTAMGDDLVSMNVGCLLLKILVQIAGTGAGVDELLAKPALIDAIAELAASQDSNPTHDTLYHVEKRVSALRREVYVALVEHGDDGESELASALNSSRERRSRSSSPSARTPPLSGEEPTFSTPRGTGRRSLSPSETEALREGDAGVSDADDDGPANENWDQGDDDEDGDEVEDDEEDEEDLEDEDEDEETRAEFVEELMLMGFPEDWCVLALKQTENDIVSASAWIVDNLEYLSKLQSTLDKERDKGRDSPRFDEEEDDVVPPDDAPQPPALNSSISSSENDQEKATSDSPSSGVKPGAKPGFTGGDGTAPPLNDKEMGRKLFGEMYFPFEDGGFLSNTKSRFMCSWRADALEMKAPSAPQPIADNSPDTPRSAFDEDFQTDANQLDLRGLIEELRRCENTLAILYTRQCMVTLLHQTTSARFPVDSAPRLSISYAQWLQLLKLVLLRGDQFAIVSRTDSTTKTPRLQEFSVDEVFVKAMSCLVNRDATSVATASLAFCLDELEAAAVGKRFEAVLWTQRDLQRPDKAVAEEPGIEVVVWLLDALLAGPTSSSLCLPSELVKSVLRRLRGCLGTTNLPLKFVALRTICRLLVVTGTQAKDAVIESQLVVREFVAAASVRHSREVMQGRLLFSQYLQGYVELVHLLQCCSGFSDLSGGGGESRPQSLVSSLLPPTTPGDPKPDGSSLHFDRKRSRSSLLAFADDGLSVSYSGNEVWKAACAVVGFSTGIHSWVVRIDKSSSPYLFVGVATRQANLDSFLGADDQSWGFIGDKALYYQRNRVRAYGEPFTEGDCIGVRLDCEKGELSFSKNGVDLGLAFDNVVGEVCPAVAFYSRQQKISFAAGSCVSSSGSSEPRIGDHESASVEDCVVACELMANWVAHRPLRAALCAAAFKMTSEWLAGSTRFVTTRSGKSLWVDVTSTTCGALGFHCEDRVRTPRGDGLVVGAAGGRVWVEVDNEPGAWFFHPSKLRLVTTASSATTSLPIPPVETGTAPSNSTLPSSRKHSSSDRVGAPSVPFTLSLEELVEYGEHALWSVAVDRELLSVINDFCEVSRLSPWNVTPSQLLALIEDKTSVLELTNVATVLAKPRGELEKLVVARFALLRFCNMYVSRALPFFDLTWHYFLPASSLLPCRLVSECRGSLFICVKNALWTALMDKTANAPKRADDEYDYPEDLPQLQVNRLKAAAAKCHEGSVSSLFLSLFGQAFEELHFLPLKTLRMVYSHPMDDGQLRSFKVKFEGEGVDDYGGPYREFFSQFFAELQMLQVPETGEDNANTSSDHSANGGPSSTSMHLDPGVSVSACVLPFLLPSPNWRNGVGANREKFVLNGALIARPVVGDTPTRRGESGEEKRQLYCEMFFFLGQMIGICLRTRVCVRLDLAMSVWKQLVAEEASAPETALETLREIDFVAYSLWKTLKGFSDELERLETGPAAAATGTKQRELEEQLEAMDLVFTTVLSDGRTVELCGDGTNTAVTRSNLAQYLDAMLGARVGETEQVLNIVKQGLHSIMPVSALALLTWTELEKRMCGVAEVDVKLLQANTEYDEELAPSDDFIQRFWRVLEGLEAEDKRAFLRFVWARSRLPLGSAQFHQKFKIQALASAGSGEGSSSSSASAGGWMDSQMPKSHTCFFALQLPRYSTDEICRERLLYAIRNCVEMDGDFRLADTEMTGWTGISPTDQLRI